METSLERPESLIFDDNLCARWKEWKQEFKIYLRAKGNEGSEEKIKVALFLNTIGKEGRRLFNDLKLDEDKESIKNVIEKFEYHCSPGKNTVSQRFKFLSIRQNVGQTFDQYLMELKTAASLCEYDNLENEIIRDQIIFGITNSKIREVLLRDSQLDLDKTAQYCRSLETRLKQCRKSEASNYPNLTQIESARSTIISEHQCKKCCSALGSTGTICKEKKVLDVEREAEHVNQNFPEAENGIVHTVNFKDEDARMEPVSIHGKQFFFKVDSGAEVNVLPVIALNQLQQKVKLQPTKIVLRSQGNEDFKSHAVGIANLSCCFKGGKLMYIRFVVANVDAPPILGSKTCTTLGLISKNQHATNIVWAVNAKANILNKYSDVFEGVGTMPGVHHIVLRTDAVPVAHSPRRIPQSIQNRLKDTLLELEKNQIISKVDTPTTWVNPLVIVEKRNGTLRLCLDPKNLNASIIGESYLVPTPEELLQCFNGKVIFSVIVMRKGFWHIKLDRSSSELCTFHTPYGKYKFNRLPFGLYSAPEVFQRKNQEIFGYLPGVTVYFDDIIVSGTCEADHDANLEALFQRARKYGIKFDKDKLQYKSRQVQYLGMKISDKGVETDEKRLDAIRNLQLPLSKYDLLQFLGLVNFFKRFIPNASDLTRNMRELITSNNEWRWYEEHTTEYRNIIKIITNPPVTKFLDNSDPITIQTDASNYGIGSCLLQNGHPIAYASRNMIDYEINYSKIEKEMLAIVFATGKFHFYIYGRSVTINTDHKPLEAIFHKELSKIPKRLQRMRQTLFKYGLTVCYLPGKDMIIPDYLSRNFMASLLPDAHYC